MADDSEVAMVRRNKRLAENIAAGRSPLDDDKIRLMRINGAAMIDAPGPRVVQLIELLDAALARVAELEAEVERLRLIESRARNYLYPGVPSSARGTATVILGYDTLDATPAGASLDPRLSARVQHASTFTSATHATNGDPVKVRYEPPIHTEAGDVIGHAPDLSRLGHYRDGRLIATYTRDGDVYRLDAAESAAD